MPYVASIDTHLRCWGTPRHRVPGDDVRWVVTGGERNREGRPRDAAGVAQYVDLVAQFGGEAVNDLDAARIGLAHNMGGPATDAAVTVPEGAAHGAR